MGVFPTPDNGVTGIGDHPWCVEVISVNVVDLNCTGGGGFLDDSNWNSVQPDGFLPNYPIIGWGDSSRIIFIFPDQLPGQIIEEEKFGTQRAILTDALIQGVVFVIMCLPLLTLDASLSGIVAEIIDPPLLQLIRVELNLQLL